MNRKKRHFEELRLRIIGAPSVGYYPTLLGRPLGYLIFSLMALIRDPIY